MYRRWKAKECYIRILTKVINWYCLQPLFMQFVRAYRKVFQPPGLPDANHFHHRESFFFICLCHRSHDTAVFVLDYLHKSFFGILQWHHARNENTTTTPVATVTTTTAAAASTVTITQTMHDKNNYMPDFPTSTMMSYENFHFSNFENCVAKTNWNDYTENYMICLRI